MCDNICRKIRRRIAGEHEQDDERIHAIEVSVDKANCETNAEMKER